MVSVREARARIEVEKEKLRKRERKISELGTRPTRKETLGVASRFRRLKAERAARVREEMQRLEPQRLRLREIEQDIERAEAAEKAAAERARAFEIARKAGGSRVVKGLSKSQQEIKREVEEAEHELDEFRDKLSGKFGEQKIKESKIETIEIKELPAAKVEPTIKEKEVMEKKPSFGARVLAGFEQTVRGQVPFLPKKSKAELIEKAEKRLTEISEADKRRLPEDVYTFKQLGEKKDFPSMIRKGFRKGGEQLVKLGNVPVKLFGGEKLTKEQTRKGGKFVGETALIGTFLGPMQTGGQIARQAGVPAKVQFVGVTQKARKGQAVTDVAFVAKRQGVKVFGRAKGVSAVKKLPSGKLYGVATGVKGVAAKRTLTIGKGLTLKEPQVFAAMGRGIGVKKGAKFAQLTGGKIAVVGKKKFAGEFAAGSLQFTGKKGVTAVAGGTITKKGTAQAAGVLFPVKRQAPTFVPKAAKKGQLLLTPLKPTVKPVAPTVAKQAGLAGTRAGVEAFATTIPMTTGVSAAAPTILTATRAPTTIQMTETFQARELPRELQPVPIPKTIPKQTPVVLTGLGQKEATKAKGRLDVGPAQVTIPAQRVIPRIAPVTPQVPRQVPKQRVPFSAPLPSVLPVLRFRPVPPPAFKMPKGKKRKKRGMGISTGEITFVPGFTSKMLGLTEKVTLPQLRAKAISPEPIGFRKIPLLVK